MKTSLFDLQAFTIFAALGFVLAVPDILPNSVSFSIQTILFTVLAGLCFQYFTVRLFPRFIFTLVTAVIYNPFFWFFSGRLTPFWLDVFFAFAFFFSAMTIKTRS